jgi:hypothetical protein
MGADGEQWRSAEDERVTCMCVEEPSSDWHWRKCGLEALRSPQVSLGDILIRHDVSVRDSSDLEEG